MQTTEKTSDTNSRRVDHGAGANGVSLMPPSYVAAAPVQCMGEGEASSSSASESSVAASIMPNHTGLPDQMKTNLESMSGFDMSDVRVHRNASEPAQVGALAYTQGTNIYLGPGQEQHLGHEAWHSVQQKQGRVEVNTQFKGMDGNDDQELEKEADVMGAKVMCTQMESAETQISPGMI